MIETFTTMLIVSIVAHLLVGLLGTKLAITTLERYVAKMHRANH